MVPYRHELQKHGIIQYINYHGCSLSLDALHDTLDRTLAEVIAVALHGQTIHTDSDCLFLILIELILCIVAVVASQLQNTIGDEVLTGSVALDDSFNQILRHICIVSQQLLGVFRQAVAAARCQVLDNFFHK